MLQWSVVVPCRVRCKSFLFTVTSVKYTSYPIHLQIPCCRTS